MLVGKYVIQQACDMVSIINLLIYMNSIIHRIISIH